MRLLVYIRDRPMCDRPSLCARTDSRARLSLVRRPSKHETRPAPQNALPAAVAAHAIAQSKDDAY
eukprot:6173214-Pleurochrysis_carterae.AAC.5